MYLFHLYEVFDLYRMSSQKTSGCQAEQGPAENQPDESQAPVMHSQVMHSKSLNLPPLQPWVIAPKSGQILAAHSNCMAGLGETQSC